MAGRSRREVEDGRRGQEKDNDGGGGVEFRHDAERGMVEVEVAWTARGSAYANNWELPDDLENSRFRVEVYNYKTLISRSDQDVPFAFIPRGSATKVRVAQIGLHQRLGEWVSIPLPPP